MPTKIAKHYVYLISDQTDSRTIPKQILLDDGHLYQIEQIIRTRKYNGLNTLGVKAVYMPL